MPLNSDVTAPSLDDIAQIAEAELNRLRPALARFIDGVPVQVTDFADDETLEEMGCETPFDLLGLYRGGGITAEARGDTGTLPAMIFLYRRPLLDYWCETGETLRRVVRHVLIHEIGHHLGLSDEDIDRIEASVE
ncbi:metallopeptidase family protein [uncultured Ferrovibrio sp.]|jgi:predicted Zn-dependent protease with MMP-like domain|uniref:metallopeptidase family protein n=1 Tax=uncultured Ferrovibrio sp. TaxID=1576913 RepID=UPI002619092F|nr:metallopeptidase family protein [uncultured Ferrovibrio sp.]